MSDKTSPVHVQLKLDKCLWCGKPLPDGRTDRKTHDRCRQNVYRWKRAPHRQAEHAKRSLRAIEMRLKYEFSFPDAIAALKAVQDEINEIYKRYNIVRVK